MAAAFLLAVTGCSDDIEKESNSQGKPLDGEAVYMTVNIMTPASSGTTTRAGDSGEDPTGGENGDGNLSALTAENYVRSATVVLYKVPDVTTEDALAKYDINTSSATIVASAYTDDVTNQGADDTYVNHGYAAKVRIQSGELQTGVPYRLLVIANADVADKFTVGGNLLATCQNAKIAHHIYDGNPAGTNAITGSDATQMGRFVMSTHQESGTPTNSSNTEYSIVTFTEDNKVDGTPAEAVAWVERLSARIDYIGNIFTFDVKQEGESGEKIAEASLLGVAPVNVAKHDMYIFKRVTEDASINSSDTKLLGDELPNDKTPNDKDAAGENYVIEPTTSETDKKQFYNEFKDGFTTGDLDISFTDFSESKWTSKPNDISTKTDKDHIICYAGENTMGITAQNHGNSTGVIFKAKYDPVSLYVYNEENGKVELETIKEKQSKTIVFYRINNKIYKELEAAEAEFIVSGNDLDENSPLVKLRKCFTKENWGEGISYDELKGALLNNTTKDLGYIAWLKTMLEEKNSLDASKMNWAAYLQTRRDIPSEKETGSKKIEKEDCATIEYYGTAHTCYYQYWIRHANNGKPTEMGVMEFCIVRNNVYQLEVTDIKGLGMADPFDSKLTPDEGDEEGYFLDVQLYVKDWVLRLNNNIVLE